MAAREGPDPAEVVAVPIVHGRATFAWEVRRAFLARRFDCVAVALPPSLRQPVIEAVEALPRVSTVVYREAGGGCGYVPIDPCDGAIEAIRLALAERAAVAMIDLEVDSFEEEPFVPPDDYAIKGIGLSGFYAAVGLLLPAAEPDSQADLRERHMGLELRRLAARFRRILVVADIRRVAGILRRFREGADPVEQESPVESPRIFSVHPDSLYHVLGELPYVAEAYERRRAAIDLDDYDEVRAIKDLVVEARARHEAERGRAYSERVSTADLAGLLRFARNLCLLRRQLVPMLYELVIAAKGTAGDLFASTLIETARHYAPQGGESPWPLIRMTAARLEIDGAVEEGRTRLPGLARSERTVRLRLPPPPEVQRQWRAAWRGEGCCSWPPEDVAIEGFCARTREKGLEIKGLSRERIEEFTTSLKDGLAIRETMRDLHRGKIYVRDAPRIRGSVGAVVFIFDEDDEKRYPWKLTWQAEHENESTLVFYAKPFLEDLVGPGIGRSEYGGALFIFPPLPLFDVWTDPTFDDAPDGMTRLAYAALYYARAPYVAYVADRPPPVDVRREARRWRKQIIYVPLSSFSRPTVRKLRVFHVLNGRDVRSYADRYIR
ncbi:MAG: hypothetical protein JXP34_28865 [Planctomycetes bacterium]|nr:hypothetical protein [Planctomycetota bacterium]